MRIAVYDTYVPRADGRTMHFDILVPEADKNIERVLQYGRRYLAAKGIPADSLRAQECQFCHMESATEAVQAAVDEDGFAIIELGNCD